MKINLPTLVNMGLANAIGTIGVLNECANFFHWAKSFISVLRSQLSGSQENDIEDQLLHLQSGLQRLRDSLPAIHNLIDGAEWRSHEHYVAQLLPKLKDAMYDAVDLLDEFQWHEMKVDLEGSANGSPLVEFFDKIIQGNFNGLNDVQGRLDHLSSQLDNIGLRVVTQHFEKKVRPETSSLPNEEKIFGREVELMQCMGLLGVLINAKHKRSRILVNASTSTLPSNQISNESRVQSVPVLPIVGIGGVGKTTLAQHVCNHEQVKSHFGLRIWICVSDDFDVKRLTKEAIQSCVGNMATSDNLDSLQSMLSNHVRKKRLLIVLDDMWDDALKENGQCWQRFCAPFRSAKEGSMMLVTTRCPKVVKGVCTMDPITLEGLKDGVFWDFFKLCTFGSKSSNNDPELKRIGRNILPKMNGSPLAAKTLGRILSIDLQASHWSSILESELWELRQEVTDILPALRLSYMYLPFYLKQCFSFCAVYPKDYKFDQKELVEIWVAEGFVVPQGDDSVLKTGNHYFQDLVARSFFQKVSGGYVIHDLLHDMAQKVSEHDCFIIRKKNDFDKVPLNVRHIYVVHTTDCDGSDLLSISKHTKLRTIICKKYLWRKSSSIMESWCAKLQHIRVLSCACTSELPNCIGNLKHLRCLKISSGQHLSIPSTFCRLYNLQTLDLKFCDIDRLPIDISNLKKLHRFISQGFSYSPGSICLDTINKRAQGIGLIKNLNQFGGHLSISNVGMLSKVRAAEAELKNKKYLSILTLNWSGNIGKYNATEVLQALQPPTCLKSILLERYPGVSLPSWFHPQTLPSLTSLSFRHCNGLENISFPTENIYSNEIPQVVADRGNTSFGISLSLTELTIYGCSNISSLEYFLHPNYVPNIKKITIQYCKNLVSVPTERLQNFRYLEHLLVDMCPILNWPRELVLPSCLQTLDLEWCGDFSACVPGCLENLSSLVSLKIYGGRGITSIPETIWRSNLPLLQELVLKGFPELASIGGANAVAQIEKVTISGCPKLNEAEQIMTRG